MPLDEPSAADEHDRIVGAALADLKRKGLAPGHAVLRALAGPRAEAAIARALATAPASAAPEARLAPGTIGFTDGRALNINVIGALRGEASFVQHHTVAARDNAARELPTLVTGRAGLVLFMPEQAVGAVSVFRTSRPDQVIALNPPGALATSDQPATDSRAPLDYTTRAWSARLPAAWMAKGLDLTFRSSDGRTGNLPASGIDFDAPAELVLQNIRIGMLTNYADRHWFEQDPALAGLDYFQKIPVRRLIVAAYLPVRLQPIRMPDGRLYTTASTDQGGVYDGDMRENIGKAMISIGINNANFGIVDTAGAEQVQPQYYRQVVVHTNVGVYANGVQVHGLSGGNGMATLISTDGNEFSHELGHNHGLGHYPGGGRWSAQNPDSGWGYDDWRSRFIGNLWWEAAAQNVVIEGVTTPPFAGSYTFNADPMAGGRPSGAITRLTLHTGYSIRRVQQAFAATPVCDPSSATGYRKWNPASHSMEPFAPGGPKPAHFGVPVVTLVGFFDPDARFDTFLCPLYGNYGQVFDLPPPSSTSGTAWLEISGHAGTRRIALSAARHATGQMNKFHINLRQSDLPVTATFVDRTGRRQSFTVPVAPAALPDPVVIGGDDGWEAAVVPRLPDFTRWAPEPPVLDSEQELERQLADTYGPVYAWRSDARSGRRPGELYGYDNPYNGRRQYFLLKADTYWYFPTDSSDNQWWRYLGDANAFVEHRPNPLRARAQAGSATLDAALKTYYGTTQLVTCPTSRAEAPSPAARAGAVGALWYAAASRRYFLQRVASAGCGDLPGSAADNASFWYVGEADDLTALFMRPMARSEADRRQAAWYRVDRFLEWGERGEDTVGRLFHYDNPHSNTLDYFIQQDGGAFYFPTNQASGGGWLYLGSFR